MHFDQFFATNRLKLQLFHFSQTITAYNALQRFAVFSESLYPQCFTWEKSSWKPYPTLKIKLIPWYVMSILLAGLNIVYLFIVVQEILSYEKDPEINIQSGILLLLTICVYSLDMVITALYVGKVNEICFVMGNFQGFRRILRKYGNIYIFHALICSEKHGNIYIFTYTPRGVTMTLDIFVYCTLYIQQFPSTYSYPPIPTLY